MSNDSISLPAGRQYETRHWAGLGGVAIVVLGVAVATQTPSLVLAAAIGVAYAGYARTVTPPQLGDVDSDEPTLVLDRSVDIDDPDPETEVELTVVVENASEQLITDFRIVDGVPDELNVVDGTPRHSDVLQPGGATSFSYTVIVTPGTFEWQPATAVVADPTGSYEQALEFDVRTTLRCARESSGLAAKHPPLQPLATPYPGRIATGESGEGIEFHSRREYLPADPLSRIDWTHLAKTGEFATVEYQRDQLARVMLVIDSRHPSYLAPDPVRTHAVQRCVEATALLFETLLDAGDQVGFTTYGPWDEDCWLPPHSGTHHRSRGRDLLDTHPAFSPEPPAHELYEWFPPEREEAIRNKRIARFHLRLLPDTQIVFFSPCCDDHTTTIVKRLHAYGHPVTIVTPDPTTDDSPVHILARRERADRLADLRGRGIRILDWPSDEPFGEALATAVRRWRA